MRLLLLLHKFRNNLFQQRFIPLPKARKIQKHRDINSAIIYLRKNAKRFRLTFRRKLDQKAFYMIF